MSIANPEIQTSLPHSFAVSVIMQQSPSSNVWQSQQWEAVAILAAERDVSDRHRVELIHQEGMVSRYLYPGFTLKLHLDECESYYHNLLSSEPRCYVVANQTDEDRSVPILVTLSFDEAHAYLEGDEMVYAVALPAEIYRWTETYVLTHYIPTKRTKRKRADWKNSARDPHEVR